MRAEVKPREADYNRDRETGKADPPAREQENRKEANRGIDMPGGKGVIFRTAHSQPIPNVLRFHRWPRPTGCNLDRATKKTRDCERDQHREKNPLRLLVSTPESDP